MASKNLSMLTKTSWKYAGGGGATSSPDNGYGAISIEVDPDVKGTFNRSIPKIYGVLKDPLSMAIESIWTTMDAVNVPFVSTIVGAVGEITQGVGEVLGGGEMGSVWKSKQVWQRSGYLHLTISFTVVDWNGNGDPLKAARHAWLYATPGPKGDYSQTPTAMVDGLGNAVDTGADTIVAGGQTLANAGGAGMAA